MFDPDVASDNDLCRGINMPLHFPNADRFNNCDEIPRGEALDQSFGVGLSVRQSREQRTCGLIGWHDVSLFETYLADLLMIHEVDRLLAVLKAQEVMMVTWAHAIPQATDTAKDAAFRHLLMRKRRRSKAFETRPEMP